MASSKLLLNFLTVLHFVYCLHGSYVGKAPKTALLHKSLELICEYTGSDSNGEFEGWYKDGAPVPTEKKEIYEVHSTSMKTTLTIKNYGTKDEQVNHWYVKTNKANSEEPIDCRFDKITLIPTPITIKTDRPNEKIDNERTSIRRNIGESVRFNCVLSPERTSVDVSNPLKWSYSQDNQKYDNLPDDATVDGEQLVINNLAKNHRGYYTCSFNNGNVTTLLRVRDRFAALWPFVGIVSAVIIFVVIILILEKRGSFLKKSSPVDDDNQDQVNDPLVRVTNKGNDDENKIRAVNT